VRNCETCGQVIPPARLTALPDATTCVTCSTTEKVQGNMTWVGKHTPVLEVVTAGKLPVQRRGFHAQIGAGSPNNPRVLASLNNLEVSREVQPREAVPPPAEEYDVVRDNTPVARCHPNRPKFGASGKCFECCLAYYNGRRGK
jgi:hypothetical protein